MSYLRRVSAFICFLASVLAFSGTPAFAQDTAEKPLPTVLMGYMDFPPLMWDDKGIPKGTLIDLTDEIAREQSLPIEYVYRPVKRLYTDVARGDIHVWIGSPDTTEIKGKVLYLDPPVVVAKLQLFARRGFMIPPFEGLKDTSLIIINGYRYGGLWTDLNDPERKLKLLPAMNHDAALDMLKAGRADYVLDYERPTLSHIINVQEPSEFDRRLVQAFPSYYNVSKNAPNAERIVEELQKGLVAVIERRIQAQTAAARR